MSLFLTACALWTAFEVNDAPLELDRTPTPERNRNTADQLADVRGEGERVIHGESV